MKRNATLLDETAAPYRSMPLWQTLPPKSAPLKSATGARTEPFSPHTIAVQQPVVVKRNTVAPPAGSLPLRVQPATIGHTRPSLPPFFSREHGPAIGSAAKLADARGVCAEKTQPVVFASQPNIDSKRRANAGRKLTLPVFIAPEPETPVAAWRAKAVSSLTPPMAFPRRLKAILQRGVATRISDPPPSALRELAPPIFRAPDRDRSATQISNTQQFALPLPQSPNRAKCQSSFQSADIWTKPVASGPSKSALARPGKEILHAQEPSTEGARTASPKIYPVRALTPMAVGLYHASDSGEPVMEGRALPCKVEEPRLPKSIGAVAPRPGTALPGGLTIWSGCLNSYVRRIVCSPKLHDNLRDVHALRLAPTKKVQPDHKNSAPRLCSTTETLTIYENDESGSELLAGKGER